MRWDVADLPMRAFVPGLTVQPLLENAIYHGIESLDRGGTVTVSGRVVAGNIEIVVTNPVAASRGDGNERPATGSRSTISASVSRSPTTRPRRSRSIGRPANTA